MFVRIIYSNENDKALSEKDRRVRRFLNAYTDAHPKYSVEECVRIGNKQLRELLAEHGPEAVDARIDAMNQSAQNKRANTFGAITKFFQPTAKPSVPKSAPSRDQNSPSSALSPPASNVSSESSSSSSSSLDRPEYFCVQSGEHRSTVCEMPQSGLLPAILQSVATAVP